MKPSSMACRMVYSWNGDVPDAPGSSKSVFVLNLGVAVKAKKLKFGWRARFIAFRSTAASFRREGHRPPRRIAAPQSPPRSPSLFSIPLSAVVVSPLCEEWASSTITAKRLPFVSIFTSSPLSSSVESAREMNGNF